MFSIADWQIGLFLIFCMKLKVSYQISTTGIADDNQEMFISELMRNQH